MSGLIRHVTVVIIISLYTGAVFAVTPSVEFSAEARQLAPQRPPMIAKMFVSANAVRTEYNMRGQRVAEIVFPNNSKRVMLFLDRSEYIEQTAAKKAIDSSATNQSAKQHKQLSPCEGIANVTCNKLGHEKISGRQAIKWEFVRNQGSGTLRSLHWIDAERNIPLREILPDGSVSELNQIGKESIDGRNVEKWKLTVTRSDGNNNQSLQWFDPELRIAIREEVPGGFLRELRNIKVGKQESHLFEIPKNYRKITEPAGGDQTSSFSQPPRSR